MSQLAYSPEDWKAVSCFSGRPATAEDVDHRRAVFAQGDSPECRVDMPLPSPLLWTDEDNIRRAGVVVQAELHSHDSQTVVLGVVEPDGQENVLLLEDAKLLTEPDGEWFRIAGNYSRSEEAAQ
jgi:hypothetical protein